MDKHIEAVIQEFWSGDPAYAGGNITAFVEEIIGLRKENERLKSFLIMPWEGKCNDCNEQGCPWDDYAGFVKYISELLPTDNSVEEWSDLSTALQCTIRDIIETAISKYKVLERK